MTNINTKIKKLIEENVLTFSTADKSSKPNVVAVAYAKVVSKNQIVVTDNYMVQTKNNVLENDDVCIAVQDKDWNGYKLIGNASYHTDGRWKQYVEKIPENKGLSTKGAILVTVSKIIKLR